LVALFVFLATVTAARANSVGSTITSAELVDLIRSGKAPIILDVRTSKEYGSGHIPGAINIPHKELKDRLKEISDHKSKEIALYCKSGRRAGIATKILSEAGFSKLRELEGNMIKWKKDRYPIE
jgi:rhodanese-related sulfurtransferase